MRLVFRLVACAALLAVLAMGGLVGDFALNKRRILYAMLGRDRLVTACRPPLAGRLRALGFEPGDIAFGELPEISISTASGRRLRVPITFTDGAAQTRVDGAVSCWVEGNAVHVEVETATTPLRTT